MIDKATRTAVVQRAANRCEYCRLQQTHYSLWLHQIEHIIPKKHFGNDELDNLALACVRCNLGKSSNLAGIDPLTNQLTSLYHPRTDNWHDHFEYVGAVISGVTAIGRVTVYVLNMNEAHRLRLRHRLLENNEL